MGRYSIDIDANNKIVPHPFGQQQEIDFIRILYQACRTLSANAATSSATAVSVPSVIAEE